MTDRFWETVPLAEMNTAQWESICDGCAKCCLHKLEDEDSGEIYYTKVVCRYLDQDSCQCGDYAARQVLVPECVKLTPDNLEDLHWMPSTCSYRLLYEGGSLPKWHPLLSGNDSSVHSAGISVRGRCISEEYVHPDGLEEHIIHWIE